MNQYILTVCCDADNVTAGLADEFEMFIPEGRYPLIGKEAVVKYDKLREFVSVNFNSDLSLDQLKQGFESEFKGWYSPPNEWSVSLCD